MNMNLTARIEQYVKYTEYRRSFTKYLILNT